MARTYAEGTFGAHVLRRILHVALSAILVYYLIPYRIYGIPRVYYLLGIMVGVPTVIEALRLKLGASVYGLRAHETKTVASYYWFILGATFLVVLLPQVISAPVVVAVAIGDPVIGETRFLRRRYWMSISVLVCLIVFLAFRYPIYLAVPAAIVTFLAESIEFEVSWHLRDSLFRSRSRQTISPWHSKIRLFFRFDDDLIMQLIPALILLIIYNLMPHAFPLPLLTPVQGTYP